MHGKVSTFTQHWKNEKTEEIVAPKKNKMNAGNLGFSQNDGNIRTLFYKREIDSGSKPL